MFDQNYRTRMKLKIKRDKKDSYIVKSQEAYFD